MWTDASDFHHDMHRRIHRGFHDEVLPQMKELYENGIPDFLNWVKGDEDEETESPFDSHHYEDLADEIDEMLSRRKKEKKKA